MNNNWTVTLVTVLAAAFNWVSKLWRDDMKTLSHIFIEIKILYTLKHMQHAVSTSSVTKTVVWCGL